MSGTEADPSNNVDDKDLSAAPVAARKSGADLLSTDDFSQYMLRTKSEMFSVFRGLVDNVSQISMFFNEGRDMVLTSLVSYDDDGLVLDFGASSELNRKALEADKLFCVTQLDKVKIQFILRNLRRIEAGGRPAFLAALPESVLRLQRREFYRLTLPITRQLVCTIPIPQQSGPPQVIEANVADISGGGLGLIGIPLDFSLDTGKEFSGCKLDLPEVGVVTAKLQVRSVFESVTRSGVRSKRAGCEFINLPGPMLTLIQRYIIKIERERKARESGML